MLLDLRQSCLQSLLKMLHDACELEFCHHREEQLRHQVVVLAYCRIHRVKPYVIFVYVLTSYLHSFQMHHLRHRVVVDDRHQDVADHHSVLLLLVYLIYKEKMMELNFLDAVQNLDHLMQDAVRLDVQQNLDEQNLDVIPPFLDVVRQFLVNPQVVVADAELLNQLKMDCFLDVVDAELLHQLKMDCFLDVVLAKLALMLLQEASHHFLQRAELLQFWQLRAWPLLPYWQSP
jgi:hypothetical protein